MSEQAEIKTNITTPSLGDDEVFAYLMKNPDFLTRNPDLLKVLVPPSRWQAGNVVDMQHFMLENLRSEIDTLRDCAQDVIETSRSNMSTQTGAHAGVLAILGAHDFAAAIRVIREDLAMLLDVDVVRISLEPPCHNNAALDNPEILKLKPGSVDNIIGANQKALLVKDIMDDGTLFGAGAGLVKSAALIRLHGDHLLPDGILAMGSRDEGMFHPGQGTELICFMASVIERTLSGWLERPAK